MTYDERMDNLPLFISYPRTGSHWINAVMELYFDRPRLREKRPTFLDPARTDWMWFHDHDLDLQIKHNDVLYLYREPVATIHSYLVYKSRLKRPLWARLVRKKTVGFTEEDVIKFSQEYHTHLIKWTNSPQKARTIICYEQFSKNRGNEFQKVCRHFGVDYVEERVIQAFDTVTPEALAEKTRNPAATGQHLLKPDYTSSRDEFRQKWGKLICEIVVTPELEYLFSVTDD